MGPTLLLDKSALESMSVDEAVWLDMFFGANITPLLYIETLADLEKTDGTGRSSERIVGDLARKTPVNSTFPNAHHHGLVLQDLGGNHPPLHTHQVVITNGQPRVDHEGKLGLHIDEFPEQAALNRWQAGQFRDIERLFAKSWRASLNSLDAQYAIGRILEFLPDGRRFSDLAAVKAFVDEFVTQADFPQLNLMLEILGVPKQLWYKIQRGFVQAGWPRLCDFAPYAAYVFKVDMFYYLCLRQNFISADRASNKADIAYLYYLPFCHAFVSKDNLHVRTAELFMENGQQFVNAIDLKAALHEMDDYYSPHAAEIEKVGLMSYVGYPPIDVDNLITQLWDRFMRPDWREVEPRSPGDRAEMPGDKELVEQLNRQRDESVPVSAPIGSLDTDYVMISRKMSARRGKWRMVSPEIEKSAW